MLLDIMCVREGGTNNNNNKSLSGLLLHAAECVAATHGCDMMYLAAPDCKWYNRKTDTYRCNAPPAKKAKQLAPLINFYMQHGWHTEKQMCSAECLGQMHTMSKPVPLLHITKHKL